MVEEPLIKLSKEEFFGVVNVPIRSAEEHLENLERRVAFLEDNLYKLYLEQ